jgi:hypothetical protein
MKLYSRRRTGVFFDSLGTLAYKKIKKDGEFVLPGRMRGTAGASVDFSF